MESNPFLAPNNDLGPTSEVSGSESPGSVSTVRAAVCAWLGTAIGGAAFGIIGFVFGIIYGFVIALVVALPITLLVFTSVRLLSATWRTRRVLLLAAAMSGGLTGLVSTFLLFGFFGIAQTLSTFGTPSGSCSRCCVLLWKRGIVWHRKTQVPRSADTTRSLGRSRRITGVKAFSRFFDHAFPIKAVIQVGAVKSATGR
jgi:hypothetical protein